MASGNNRPKPSIVKKPIKQISACVHWSFTVNNYTEEHISTIVLKSKSRGDFYIFQEEKGENGTAHLQGYYKFKHRKRPLEVFSADILPAHWEKARSPKDLIAYCSDPNKRNGRIWANMPYPEEVKIIEPDYDWEQEILQIIENDPDDRFIFWYWSQEGNVGKTSFCKYLTVKHGAIALHGKGADVRNGVVQYKHVNGVTPKLVVYPIPRCFNTDYISYESLENIKDMYFYSGKYEGGMICGNSPHLFVFANTPPDETKMSKDRWVIKEI